MLGVYALLGTLPFVLEAIMLHAPLIDDEQINPDNLYCLADRDVVRDLPYVETALSALGFEIVKDSDDQKIRL